MGFQQLVEAGQAFPETQDKFFLRASSLNPSDVIGLVNCSVAPTASASDPMAVPFLESSCPVDERVHVEAKLIPSAVRMWQWKFRFTGFEYIYFTCVVRRCYAEPCGSCANDGRRLLAQSQNDEKLATFQLRLFPEPVLTGNVTNVWETLTPYTPPEKAFVHSSVVLSRWTTDTVTGIHTAVTQGIVAETLGVDEAEVHVLSAAVQLPLVAEPTGAAIIHFNVVTGTHRLKQIEDLLTELSLGGPVTGIFAAQLATALHAVGLESLDGVSVRIGEPELIDPKIATITTTAANGLLIPPSATTATSIIVILAVSCVAYLACMVGSRRVRSNDPRTVAPSGAKGTWPEVVSGFVPGSPKVAWAA